jgi:putative SOS response-associated peptidase YedK
MRTIARPNGKAKQPYAIALRDRQPFAFAGLWENWKDPVSLIILGKLAITLAAHAEGHLSR